MDYHRLVAPLLKSLVLLVSPVLVLYHYCCITRFLESLLSIVAPKLTLNEDCCLGHLLVVGILVKEKAAWNNRVLSKFIESLYRTHSKNNSESNLYKICKFFPIVFVFYFLLLELLLTICLCSHSIVLAEREREREREREAQRVWNLTCLYLR